MIPYVGQPVHVVTTIDDQTQQCLAAIVTKRISSGIFGVTIFTPHGSGQDVAHRMQADMDLMHDPRDCPDATP